MSRKEINKLTKQELEDCLSVLASKWLENMNDKKMRRPYEREFSAVFKRLEFLNKNTICCPFCHKPL